MTDTNRPLRVFLCHATSDKPAVRELHRRLTADGFAPWLDEEDLLPGHDWQYEIPKAVRQSDVVIVCLSPQASNKAGYVQKEIKFALDAADEQPEGTIFLIPLKLAECTVPDRLSRWQWVYLFSPNGYERLLRALRQRAADLDVPPSAPALNAMTWGGLQFVRVPAGKFLMGSKDDNKLASDDERPQHTVEIAYDYWIGKYPVTNKQFAQFVASAQYQFDQGDWQKKANHPVINATWRDAMAYCQWLNETLRGELKGQTLRLPTEAEWEKAARGTQGYEWPWGNEFDQSKCNSSEGGKGSTTSVDDYSSRGDSPYGAADMAGNVLEWCHSIYKPYSYSYQADDGRENESGSEWRVLRGGAFGRDRGYARCAFRNDAHPDIRRDDLGWRVVVSPGSRL